MDKLNETSTIIISVPLDANLFYRIDDPVAARKLLDTLEKVAERIDTDSDTTKASTTPTINLTRR